MRPLILVLSGFLVTISNAQTISSSGTFWGNPGAWHYITNINKSNNNILLWFPSGSDTIFQGQSPISFKSQNPYPLFPSINPTSAIFIVLDALNELDINLQFSASDDVRSLSAIQSQDGAYLLTYTIPHDSVYLNNLLFIADSSLKEGALCLNKISPYGAVIFTNCFPSEQNGGRVDQAFIQQLPGGKIVLAGRVTGGGSIMFDSINLPCIGCNWDDSDIFVALLDSTGHTLNARRFGGELEEYIWDMKVAPDNNIYLTGGFYTKDFYYDTLHLQSYLPWFSPDAFLLKIDSALNPIWIKQAGSKYHEFGRSISFDEEGNVYWGGDFSGASVIMDGDTLFGGNTNSFIAKMDASGQISWKKAFIGGYAHYLYDIAWSPDGTIWAALKFQDSLILDGFSIQSLGKRDAALVQLDEHGNILSYYIIASAGTEQILNIQVLTDHQLFVSGSTDLEPGDSLKFLNMTLQDWPNHSGPGFYFVLDLPVVGTSTPPADQNVVSLMPNPIRKGSRFRVEIPAGMVGELALMDAAGRRVWMGNSAAGAGLLEIPAPGQSGVYFLSIRTEKGIYAKKIIVTD